MKSPILLLTTLSSGVFSAIISAYSPITSAPTSVDTHCPTITKTGAVCSTCAIKECALISTISNPCDCSSPVPTVTVNYPCSAPRNCPPGCALTLYVSASSSSTCSPTTDLPPFTPSSSSSSITPTPSCPTVTSTIDTCSTCMVAQCVVVSSISRPCSCPTAIPTQWTAYPCASTTVTTTITTTILDSNSSPAVVTARATAVSGPCPGGCAYTSYVYVPDDCPTKTDTRVTCTPTVTVSQYPTSGCPYSCSTGWNACIMDKFVTRPCGCDVVGGVKTATKTVPCATSTPCYMCNTGFPWTTTATDCATPTPTLY